MSSHEGEAKGNLLCIKHVQVVANVVGVQGLITRPVLHTSTSEVPNVNAAGRKSESKLAVRSPSSEEAVDTEEYARPRVES